MKKITETPEETIQKIKNMSQEELARLWRFAPSNHPYFDTTLPYYKVFNECFKGFTSELSKKIGW
jgi:hypothetical protein